MSIFGKIRNLPVDAVYEFWYMLVSRRQEHEHINKKSNGVLLRFHTSIFLEIANLSPGLLGISWFLDVKNIDIANKNHIMSY